jgi:hypothetical protein
MRSCILAALRLLAWLDTTERTLETLTQHDVDLWLATHEAEYAYVAKEFLRWARTRGLTGEVAIPQRPRSDNPHVLDVQERWNHLDRCLTDTTLPDDVRAAGALSLLYGLTVSRISRLRSSDLHTNETVATETGPRQTPAATGPSRRATPAAVRGRERRVAVPRRPPGQPRRRRATPQTQTPRPTRRRPFARCRPDQSRRRATRTDPRRPARHPHHHHHHHHHLGQPRPRRLGDLPRRPSRSPRLGRPFDSDPRQLA